MIEGIQGDDGLSKAQKKELQQDYKEAAKGFQAALDKYNELENKSQKGECKQVMHEYMNVMNHVAAALRKEKLLQQTNQLDADLNSLDVDDTATQKIKADLNKSQEFI